MQYEENIASLVNAHNLVYQPVNRGMTKHGHHGILGRGYII